MTDETPTPDEIRATPEYRELKEAGHTDSAIIQSVQDAAKDTQEGDEAPKEEGGSGPGDATAATPEGELKPLDEMTFDELMDVAKHLDIKGRSSMDKEALFDAIVSHQD